MAVGQLLVQLLNSAAYGMLLFLLAAGLSIIFGLMDVLNLAHGSLYLLGGYAAVTITRASGSLWYALLLAPILVGAFGLLLEKVLIRRVYQRGHMQQALLTFGFVYIVGDLSRAAWGSDVLSVSPPPALAGSVTVFGQIYPVYRLFLIGFGLVLAASMWFVQERTRIGAILRAGVSDRPMISALGINIGLVFTIVFGAGAALAGAAGAAALPMLSVYPGADFAVLLLTLIVVVVGGLGTLSSAFWGAMVISLVDTFGRAMFPRTAMFLIYALMAFVLVLRPTGLFGKAA